MSAKTKPRAAKAQPAEVDTHVRWKKIAPKSVPFAQYERDVKRVREEGFEDATRYQESMLPEKLDAARRQAVEEYERHSPELLTLNATYRVAPGTTGIQLHEDIGDWLECAEALAALLAEHINRDSDIDLTIRQSVYSVQYLIQMARGALAASYVIDAAGDVA